jgi:hypothetical protein
MFDKKSLYIYRNIPRRHPEKPANYRRHPAGSELNPVCQKGNGVDL